MSANAAPPAGGRARRAGDLAWVAAALVLALVPVAAYAVRLAKGPAPTTKPWLFPAGSRGRVDALRDRVARGLLSLQLPGGGFAPPDVGVPPEPIDRAEATALGLAGLAAAERMGCGVGGLADGVRNARAALIDMQSRSGQFGVSPRGRRGVAVSALASGVLGLSLSRVGAGEEAFLEAAGRALVFQCSLGSQPGGWVHGVAVRALAQLVEDGRGAWLGEDRVAAIPSQPIELARRVIDSHVSQALALSVQTHLGAPPLPLPEAVLRRKLEEGPAWTGVESDMNSWVLDAWLAARLNGGEAWFAAALGELEKAPAESGVVEGDYYGYPVARTAGLLLILWEGAGRRPVGAP